MLSAKSLSCILDVCPSEIYLFMFSSSFEDSIPGCGKTSWNIGSFGTFDL